MAANDFVQIKKKSIIDALGADTSSSVPLINVNGKWTKMIDLNYYALLTMLQAQQFNSDSKRVNEVKKGVKTLLNFEKSKIRKILPPKLAGYQLLMKDKFQNNSICS